MKYLTRDLGAANDAREALLKHLKGHDGIRAPRSRERREAKSAALVSHRAALEYRAKYTAYIAQLKAAGLAADDPLIRRWEDRLAGTEDAIAERWRS